MAHIHYKTAWNGFILGWGDWIRARLSPPSPLKHDLPRRPVPGLGDVESLTGGHLRGEYLHLPGERFAFPPWPLCPLWSVATGCVMDSLKWIMYELYYSPTTKPLLRPPVRNSSDLQWRKTGEPYSSEAERQNVQSGLFQTHRTVPLYSYY